MNENKTISNADYIIDKLAKELADIKVNNANLEFQVLAAKQTIEKLQNELEETKNKLKEKEDLLDGENNQVPPEYAVMDK